jgi:hypothetical protein
MKHAFAVILVFMIIPLILAAGCVSSPPVGTPEQQQVTTTPTCSSDVCPVPSPTATETASLTVTTVTPAITQSPAIPNENAPDPIIGNWQLENGPYTCTATFSGSGTGHLSCSLYMMSQSKDFSWENEGNPDPSNASYRIVLSDGSGTVTSAVIGPDGHMTSGVLPAGSYLVKLL